MTMGEVVHAVTGQSDPSLQSSTVQQIGLAAKKLDDLANDLKARADASDDEKATIRAEMDKLAQGLTSLKATHEAEEAEAKAKAQAEEVSALISWSQNVREPSKARMIGSGPISAPQGYEKGSFLYGVFEASGRDAERQQQGKAILSGLAQRFRAVGDVKAGLHEEAWGKATLGTTDATGGWVIPNAIVDEFIKPATIDNIYRTICTVVPGVTAFAVDIPFRSATRTRAAVVAFGQTKENLDLAYNGYTATMYTIARIYDIGNQFLRQSRGAAEQDVLQELAAAFAQGEAYYVREGSGSSQPYGYTSALTSGPAAFRSSFTPSSTTLAGSMATAIATAAGALAGRGVGSNGRSLAAVLSASSYWTMLAQGTDNAGFFFNPASGPEAINAPAGTLISPFGIPVYPDADADLEGTAAVIDNLVVGEFKRFKLYFGESYRVDSSDQAGSRWDTNLTGFRGEEEMGFDARPAVYAGYFQLITDITP